MEHKSNPIIEGNVIFNKIDENGVIHIFLSSEFTLTTHWFYFKTISKDIGSERIIFSIDNATSSIFCKGWYNYSPFLSYNGKNWTRIDNGIVENNSYLFFIKNCHKDFFIAYYPPYQLETYREWLNKISSNFKNGKIIINNTLPDCIILGDHLKPSIIIVSRQHPGEVMPLM